MTEESASGSEQSVSDRRYVCSQKTVLKTVCTAQAVREVMTVGGESGDQQDQNQTDEERPFSVHTVSKQVASPFLQCSCNLS